MGFLCGLNVWVCIKFHRFVLCLYVQSVILKMASKRTTIFTLHCIMLSNPSSLNIFQRFSFIVRIGVYMFQCTQSVLIVNYKIVLAAFLMYSISIWVPKCSTVTSLVTNKYKYFDSTDTTFKEPVRDHKCSASGNIKMIRKY